MTQPVRPFELDFLAAGDHLTRLVEEQFKSSVRSCDKIGQGFYAHIYKLSLHRNPGEVVVKCHKYPGYSAKEKRQLEVLRQHAVARVPEVYSLHLSSDEFPCEAFTMEHIPGVNASTLEFPDESTRMRFVDQVIENLLAWHGVSHPEGFGEFDGPFYPTWRESFGRRIAAYRERIHAEPHEETVSSYVMSVIDRSCEAFAAIFRNGNPLPSLAHSDYNAWNMMADPQTFELTGVIDPIDAGWCDPEIDLFHLSNCRPEIGLLERYLRERGVDESFWMRYRFYRFWDDIKHYLRVGWYDEERFSSYAKELETSMNECLQAR